ncbi:LacI family DNA-binding transcriptional regulator [Leifsonia sp. Root4]|uniref:LacI family DNA-binding transcriptional regulator n=1 Tax=Leifsonia sp. Root4 TaxID=1736525 RepID=UPI0009E8210C|nr:LacI family DNA-binding transcriptional regulator [Leifsonia sp. Root4]
MDTSEGLSRPATSVDVARHAGVSRSTVSNILNGNDARFPERTRQRVLDAARELQYRPSLAARSLVSGRSDTVVVLIPNTTFGSNLQDAVDQMMAGTSKFGGNVIVRFAGSTPDATIHAITALRPLAVVDFGVLSRAERAPIEEFGTIIVPSLTATSNVESDGGIGRIQAEALLENGRRPLWFAALADARLDPYGPRRYLALRDYCEGVGLPEPRHLEVPLKLEGAIAALRPIVDEMIPAGIACYNDDVAVAILSAARELGASVPDRLAIVGVDHTALGQLWSPRLTTVDTDFRGMVRGLAHDLSVRLGNEQASDAPPARHFTLVHGDTA